MTTLRKLIRAIDGYGYELEEFTLSPNRIVTRKVVLARIHETTIRSQVGDHYESDFGGGEYHSIPEATFNSLIQKHKGRKIVRRNKETGETIEKILDVAN